jgi:hypothetical protein
MTLNFLGPLIKELDHALAALSNARSAIVALTYHNHKQPRRKMSPAARKRIADAQRKRWIAWKREQRKAAQ